MWTLGSKPIIGTLLHNVQIRITRFLESVRSCGRADHLLCNTFLFTHYSKSRVWPLRNTFSFSGLRVSGVVGLRNKQTNKLHNKTKQHTHYLLSTCHCGVEWSVRSRIFFPFIIQLPPRSETHPPLILAPVTTILATNVTQDSRRIQPSPPPNLRCVCDRLIYGQFGPASAYRP